MFRLADARVPSEPPLQRGVCSRIIAAIRSIYMPAAFHGATRVSCISFSPFDRNRIFLSFFRWDLETAAGSLHCFYCAEKPRFSACFALILLSTRILQRTIWRTIVSNISSGLLANFLNNHRSNYWILGTALQSASSIEGLEMKNIFF